MQKNYKVIDRRGKLATYKYDRDVFSMGLAPQGERRYIIKNEFEITLHDGRVITIEKDFKFDGASVPRALWIRYSPFDPRYMVAAAVHDWLYLKNGIDRFTADEIFRNLLMIEGNNELVASAMFLGVRSGGWIGWNHYRKNDK